MDQAHIELAAKRGDREIVLIWLREFRVRIDVAIFFSNDLDLFSDSINGSREMSDKPEIQTEQIFHETKFVFLSCARVSEASVVHTTVDVNIQEAWTHAPKKTKCETTHIVKCETQIFRVKNH